MSARRAPGSARDPELEAGSAAHYEDPAHYTKTYDGRTDDVRYYVELAASRSPSGPVLEYGCGNGRIAIPLARAGIEVSGVDLSAPMLADLRVRLKGEAPQVRKRVRVQRGDMRTTRVGRRFPQIFCAFNTLLHLYTRDDVERFLARVARHLEPGGELVFDVSIPQPPELARDPSRAYRTKPFMYPLEGGGSVRVGYAERFDYDPVRQVLFVAMEFTPEDGRDPWMTPLAHRQFYPQELEALLHYNGFAITEQYGGFDRSPLAADSATNLVHCKLRRGS